MSRPDKEETRGGISIEQIAEIEKAQIDVRCQKRKIEKIKR